MTSNAATVIDDALAKMERQAAEIERLRAALQQSRSAVEALRPFADLATGEVADSKEDSSVLILMEGHKRYAAISMKDLRRAKAALSQESADA